MQRTAGRPIPPGTVQPAEALRPGLLLAVSDVGGAVVLDPLYGVVVFAGLFFDVVAYTVWLKRRTPWAILWGGVSGGMPALAVLFWIPTHIMTFSMRYFEDYRRAGLPSFPTRYGFRATRMTIAVSSLLAALIMEWRPMAWA